MTHSKAVIGRVLVMAMVVACLITLAATFSRHTAEADAAYQVEAIHTKLMVRSVPIYVGNYHRVEENLYPNFWNTWNDETKVYTAKNGAVIWSYMKWVPDTDISIIGVWLYVETDYGREDFVWHKGATSLDAEVSTDGYLGSDNTIARCVTTDWYDGNTLSGNHADSTLLMFPSGYGRRVSSGQPIYVNMCSLNEAMAKGCFWATIKVLIYYSKR